MKTDRGSPATPNFGAHGLDILLLDGAYMPHLLELYSKACSHSGGGRVRGHVASIAMQAKSRGMQIYLGIDLELERTVAGSVIQ